MSPHLSWSCWPHDWLLGSISPPASVAEKKKEEKKSCVQLDLTWCSRGHWVAEHLKKSRPRIFAQSCRGSGCMRTVQFQQPNQNCSIKFFATWIDWSLISVFSPFLYFFLAQCCWEGGGSLRDLRKTKITWYGADASLPLLCCQFGDRRFRLRRRSKKGIILSLPAMWFYGETPSLPQFHCPLNIYIPSFCVSITAFTDFFFFFYIFKFMVTILSHQHLHRRWRQRAH